jgi:hypothetical protein
LTKAARRLSNQNGDVTISKKNFQKKEIPVLLTKAARRLSNQNGDVTNSKKFYKNRKKYKINSFIEL